MVRAGRAEGARDGDIAFGRVVWVDRPRLAVLDAIGAGHQPLVVEHAAEEVVERPVCTAPRSGRSCAGAAARAAPAAAAAAVVVPVGACTSGSCRGMLGRRTPLPRSRFRSWEPSRAPTRCSRSRSRTVQWRTYLCTRPASRTPTARRSCRRCTPASRSVPAACRRSSPLAAGHRTAWSWSRSVRRHSHARQVQQSAWEK